MARILLIDDDISVRTILRLTLTHFGHTVTEAVNGREGLKLFVGSGGHAHDLVLTDIVMPEQDGLGFLIELRKQRSPVKIIAMSAGGRIGAADYLQNARLLGAQRVLTKPFSQAVLLATIGELLPPDAAPAIRPCWSTAPVA